MITLPKVAKIAIETLYAHGYEAYAVGGCVRDLGLGKVPYDIDITTSAIPEEIEDSFAGYKIIKTGAKHGTIGVIIEGLPVEITTYRIDGEYNDFRHPQTIEFTRSLKEDLSRRDFTINALCYNDREGLIDLFDGVNDLENRIIKPIGDGKKRFSEDPLRILRAFRFMAQLGFNITEETLVEINLCKDLLKNISMERITSEISKILTCDAPSKTLFLINKFELLDYIPNLSYEDLRKIDNSKRRLIIRLALLYANSNNSTTEIEMSLKNQKFSNEVIKLTMSLIENKDIDITPDDIYIKRNLNKFSLEGFILILDFMESYKPQVNSEIIKTRNIIDRIITNQECYLTKDLKINGNNLKNIGIKDGIEIGRILNELLSLVYQDNSLNERKTLLTIAKDMRR